FESGARMGIGAFSLLVSMLPATVLRLLHSALEQLEAAAAVTTASRAPLAQLLLASYYANQAQVMARQDCQSAERWLRRLQRAAPRQCSAAVPAGRIGVLQGQPEVGLRHLELSSAAAGADWLQLRLLCDWEMMWVAACRADWPAALVRAERLAGGSNWSKATMAYIRACFLYHARCTGNGSAEAEAEAEAEPEPEPKPNRNRKREPEVQIGIRTGNAAEKDDNLLMQQLQSMCRSCAAPRRPHAAAGQVRGQAEPRWLEQSGRLILPGLELLIVWGVCHLIEPDCSRRPVFYLRCRPSQTAEQCLLEVTDTLSGRVHRDRHVIAWAWLELAGLQTESGRAGEAGRAYSPRAPKNAAVTQGVRTGAIACCCHRKASSFFGPSPSALSRLTKPILARCSNQRNEQVNVHKDSTAQAALTPALTTGCRSARYP
uniref:FAT domain-containing protein n=1 Tax=Macrostomum lignano TaxID=282301 RepID=A0A1I8F860_9PLAT